jgi:hypothetical protein
VPPGTLRLAFAVGLIAAVVTAYWLGRAAPPSAHWETGHADVVAGTRVTIETDDWTYGFESDLDWWIDDSGSHHQGGMPECLRTQASGDIHFAWLGYTDGSITSRTVVAVDCRG